MARESRQPIPKPPNPVVLRGCLLHWYERNRRDLPWRRTCDPYAIWVSEIMLQQTRVAAVVERYQAFLARFPSLLALAQSPLEDVLALWSGLGYYRRARMLHQAAQYVAANFQGILPAGAAELRALPGIGAYTGAAIASIAHGQAVAVVDGNVERVLSRIAGWHAASRADAAALRPRIEKLANQLLDPRRPGDFNQALMELGATVCLPRNPQCTACPLRADCKTRGEHQTPPRPRMLAREAAYALSVRTRPKSIKPRPGKPGSKQLRSDDATEVLLEQRPASQSVMPGLWELPALRDPLVPDQDLRMTLRHSIMQVNYTVRVRAVARREVSQLTVRGGRRRWVALDQAAAMALTGLARKVLIRARLLPARNAIAPHPQIDVL